MEKVSGIRCLARVLTRLKEKTDELVAVEQNFSPNCLGSREGVDGVDGAMFHEGFQQRVRQ